MWNIFSKGRFGKIGSKKVLYIIALTSVFWFSLNVLLLIANNEAALDSLSQLNNIVHSSRERRDSHFMSDMGIKPLEPAHKLSKKQYPWLKINLWSHRYGVAADTKNLPPGRTLQEVYDVSKLRNTNPGLGENGEAAYLKFEEDKKLAEKLFANHSFNSILSQKISLDRVLLDVRGER